MNIADTHQRQHHRTDATFILRLLLLLTFVTLTSRPSLAQQIFDQDGEKLILGKPFSRIISLYPAHTENLAQLGLGTEIIGISTSDTYPQAITAKPRFSDEDNAEKFIAADPDLILIRPMISRAHPELVKRLRQTGITVVSLQPTTIADMFSYWQILGQLTGKTSEAQAMQKRFQADVDRIQRRLPQLPPDRRPGVYFEAIHSKMKTFSPTSIAMFAVEAAGGRNIASDAVPRNDSNIAEYGKERILARAEEIDVFLSQQGRMNRVDLDTLKQEPGFQIIKAFRENRVYLIDETEVSRPTQRLLQGIEKIAGILYPSR